ncbi:MAG: hypothetical protein ACOYJF_03310 [Prevotella sp.]|jgi:hypothetical protein
MITKDSIESAYCFFHQKLRIYEKSTLDWQRDDIEYAIADYTNRMSQELYAQLSDGRPDYLRDHQHFEADLRHAVEKLESPA